jgi:uncharacterized protein (TIRG00374 family)
MNSGGLSRLLRLLIAVGLTGYVLWKANPALVMRDAGSLDWRWAAAAIVLVLLDRALMAYRWIVLLCALTPGSRPPFRHVLRIFFISTFVGSFLPGVAGDVYRALSLSRLRVSGVESAASVIMDRALGVLSMVVVAIGALGFATEMLAVPGVTLTVALAAAGCAVGAIGLYSERAAAAALRIAVHLPGRRPKKLGVGLIEAVRRYAHHHGELTYVLLASIAVQAIRVLQAFCLGMAIGIGAPLWAYFLFIPVIVIVMQLPISISGLGTSQLLFPIFFGRLGVPASEAVALSLLFVALGVIGNLPGALLYATKGPSLEPERNA